MATKKAAAGLKEAKSVPWDALEKAAKKADAPTGQATWNNRRTRKEGDTLTGVVGDIVETMTGFGRGQVMHVTDREGKQHGVFLSAVLKNQIDNVGGFKEGDAVFIKYLGVPKGKRYALYAVGKL